MYSKIAVSNVKKSFKDYAIYFLTLTLAVCIFYSFNSMGAQKALKSAQASSLLQSSMAYLSVLVSVTLGSLILYANNFLIKKRKKELGIYMILGMGKRKVSSILVTETFMVGVISLMSGLALGIVASQGLSAFALKLFEFPMDEYKFAVSTDAIGKTILYFGMMFLLVMIFNVFVISKYKVMDLLTAGKKNEDVKFKNPIMYLITFALCVGSLGYAYKTILHEGINFRNPMFFVAIVCGIVGTLLFFFSLSGFILYIVKKNKRVYFKKLNIFVIKQINSKVNTNFLSMSLICVMLLITIVVLSSGLSFKQAVEDDLKKATPFDASVILSNGQDNNLKDVEDVENVLNKINFKWSKNEKYAAYNEYTTQLSVGEFLNSEDKFLQIFDVPFVKVSDYNKILQLKGEKEIHLNKDEVLILAASAHTIQPINEKLNKSNKITIKGKEYLVKNQKAIEESLRTTSGMVENLCTIIINDEFVSGYKWSASILDIKYLDKNREENNKKYAELLPQFYDAGYQGEAWTNDGTYSETKGDTVSAVFIGIYLGIVFLITSMAVLALQQLSEASDSIERYRALKKIGADEKMINKTIFTQTCIYFSLPILLALIHSVVGIKVMSDFLITTFNAVDLSFPAFITALIFIVVYVGYFLITYIGYKNIVKSNV